MAALIPYNIQMSFRRAGMVTVVEDGAAHYRTGHPIWHLPNQETASESLASHRIEIAQSINGPRIRSETDRDHYPASKLYNMARRGSEFVSEFCELSEISESGLDPNRPHVVPEELQAIRRPPRSIQRPEPLHLCGGELESVEGEVLADPSRRHGFRDNVNQRRQLQEELHCDLRGRPSDLFRDLFDEGSSKIVAPKGPALPRARGAQLMSLISRVCKYCSIARCWL